MAVAGKVIGAVRLGLVDVKILIEELKTEEMQRVPEVNIHLQESMMHHCMPSHEFAAEKMKLRSMRPLRKSHFTLLRNSRFHKLSQF